MSITPKQLEEYTGTNYYNLSPKEREEIKEIAKQYGTNILDTREGLYSTAGTIGNVIALSAPPIKDAYLTKKNWKNTGNAKEDIANNYILVTDGIKVFAMSIAGALTGHTWLSPTVDLMQTVTQDQRIKNTEKKLEFVEQKVVPVISNTIEQLVPQETPKPNRENISIMDRNMDYQKLKELLPATPPVNQSTYSPYRDQEQKDYTNVQNKGGGLTEKQIRKIVQVEYKKLQKHKGSGKTKHPTSSVYKANKAVSRTVTSTTKKKTTEKKDIRLVKKPSIR